jgi:hypothetical protein
MGQIQLPQSPQSLILSAVDRLVASNADGGLAVGASHIILLGEGAGRNLAASNIIAIGWKAFQGGLVGFPAGDADNSTVVGENSFVGEADLTTGKLNGLGAVTVLGGSNLAAVTTARRMAGLIVIGAGIMPDFTGAIGGGMDRSILIGNSIFAANTLDNALSADNIIIGHHAARRASLNGQATQYIENVIIGAEGGPQTDTASSMTGNTIIGARAGQQMNTGGGENTIIGRRTAPSLTTGAQNVVLGAGADLAGTSTDTIVIGQSNTKGNTTDSIYIGGQQVKTFTGARNIVIGRGAGDGEPAAGDDKFIIETFNAAKLTILYGSLASGSLIVGNSTGVVNRDMPGTNILKLLNGTRTGVAPVGGGFFSVVGGELFWVSSTGNVSQLSDGGAGFTVATLPAGFQGQRAFVTDALAPAFGAALVGGGAVVIPAFFDGAAWIAG